MPEIVTAFSAWESKFVSSLNEMENFLKTPPEHTKIESTIKGTKHGVWITLLYFKDRDVVLGRSFSITKCPIYVANNVVRTKLIRHIADRGLESIVSMTRWGGILGMSSATTIRSFKEVKNQ